MVLTKVIPFAILSWMNDLFKTGVIPAVNTWLLNKAEEERDYKEYWPASSAGYCQRKVIFDRLRVPHVKDDPRKQRVFTSGSVIHAWVQEITKNAGLSIAQELELRNEDLMVMGHIDDLILIDDKLILYDYKSVNSRAFTYMKGSKMSHYHGMQLGTYMYMLRRQRGLVETDSLVDEGRILKISRDDLRMTEQELLWSPQLEKMVYDYWTELNALWEARKLPQCTCADHENGFMAREAYNTYFYKGEPCSIAWFNKAMAEGNIEW